MRQAFADGGEIIMYGCDETLIGPTKKRPRKGVLWRLYHKGMFHQPVGLLNDTFKTTEAARVRFDNGDFTEF